MKYIEIEGLIAEMGKRQLRYLHLYDEHPDDYYLGKAHAYGDTKAFLEAVTSRNPGDNIGIII